MVIRVFLIFAVVADVFIACVENFNSFAFSLILSIIIMLTLNQSDNPSVIGIKFL